MRCFIENVYNTLQQLCRTMCNIFTVTSIIKGNHFCEKLAHAVQTTLSVAEILKLAEMLLKNSFNRVIFFSIFIVHFKEVEKM